MWIEEAIWIGEQVKSLAFHNQQIECLNIGSSTKRYREVEKPYIKEHVLTPITRIGSITHLDVKAECGVDICGDLTNPSFRANLAKKKYDLVLCNNVLTHVRNVADVFEAINNCVADFGFVIISAPMLYPYCADPYDSKYRPSRADIESMLPSFTTIRFTMFERDETSLDRLFGSKTQMLAFLINIVLPRRGIQVWKNTVADLAILNRKLSTIAMVMQKTTATERHL